MTSSQHERDDQKARLAAALRENLKRRKAQARARRADPRDRDGTEPTGAEPDAPNS